MKRFILALLLLLSIQPVAFAKYLGDFTEDHAALNFKFTSRQSTGAPFTLAGTPVVSVYKANSVTQHTTTYTPTVDFDAVTGLNNVLIDLSADAFYAVGNDYHVVITTGTVNSISVVGEVVATFSIENRFDEVTLAASQPNYAPARSIHAGTAASGTTSTITLDAGASTDADHYNGSVLNILTGTQAGQSRVITDYTATTKVATVTPNWGGTGPSGTSTFEIVQGSANVTSWLGSAADAAITETDLKGYWRDVLNEAIPGSPTADSYNQRLAALDDLLQAGGAGDAAAALGDTNELQTNQGNWLTATGFATTAEIANVPTVAEFDARTLLAASYFDPATDAVANVTTVGSLTGHTAQTGDNYARLGAPAGASVSADLAALDVLLDSIIAEVVAASGEPTGAPGVSTSMQVKVNWLYKAFRNKVTQTATQYSLLDDDQTTVGTKATTADDGTTFSRTELETGP